MEKVNELENLVQTFKEDYEKFMEKGIAPLVRDVISPKHPTYN